MAGSKDPELADGPAPSQDGVPRALRDLAGRARREAHRAARAGRRRLERMQARRDLERLYAKLGRETARLVEAGEVDHPGLVGRIERIHQAEQAVARGDDEP